MCTGIRLIASNGDVVYARTLEFDTPLPAALSYVPRGQSFVGVTASGEDGRKWKNAHAFGGSVFKSEMNGVNIDGGDDGMNEHGLVCGIFNLPGFTEFTRVTDANRDKCIAIWQVVPYILGNFKTCAEVRKAVAESDFVVADTLFPFPGTPAILPNHCRVGDASGDTIVLEWHKAGELPQVYHSETGVITNSPDYQWQVNNWNRFKHLSPYNPSGPIHPGSQDYKLTMGNGYVGMPGGSNPPDRFVRASLYARDTYPGEDGESAVWIAWHVMNLFDIPPGVMRNIEAETKTESTEYNLWTCIADTKNFVYYFRGFYDNGIFEIDFKKMDATGPKRLQSMAAAGKARRTIPVFTA
ncbi:nucleophile aminohydrolase [Hyaloraphidium curvatum]|nr:nucleophile aminohydrolase [Hyaloraphidium curvatum]